MSLVARVGRRAGRSLDALADLRRRAAVRSQERPRSLVRAENLEFGSVLVVVAHPDDEVIAAAGLLSRSESAGVICASDGAPRNPDYARRAGFSSRFDYARARRRESEAALALLGRDPDPSLNLGIVDQEVTSELVALARFLVTVIESGFNTVVTHAYEGGHPDHDAVAFAVHAAVALIVRSGGTAPLILEASIYNGAGAAHVLQQFLPRPDAGPTFALDLSAEERDLKRRMLATHATQLHLLREFELSRECFRPAPPYHFSLPPHHGRLGFDEFRWPINGRRWRRAAWRAIRELELVNELA